MATIQPTTTPPHLLVRPMTGADADAVLRIYRAAPGTPPSTSRRNVRRTMARLI
ncbi:MAG TPA: hypothetical protein VF462_00220 [Micromonosporaceae bacterium]